MQYFPYLLQTLMYSSREGTRRSVRPQVPSMSLSITPRMVS